MSDPTHDSWLPISADAADAVARSLTSNRIGVLKTGGSFYLTHADKRSWVKLLPYQLTVGGIREAIANNDPWPE
jgi:hypothetical protein